jgi:ferredoxin
MSKEKANKDIYQLLLEASKKREKKRKTKLLEVMGVKEFFEEGTISIDKNTCKGVECKLCIKACPTNALYWKTGEIDIVEELCVYCAACVYSCIVDNCIQISRKRPNNQTEKFSTQKQVLTLLQNIGSKQRIKAMKALFPSIEAFLERYSE